MAPASIWQLEEDREARERRDGLATAFGREGSPHGAVLSVRTAPSGSEQDTRKTRARSELARATQVSLILALASRLALSLPTDGARNARVTHQLVLTKF